MGLAPYGDPERHLAAMRKIARSENGSFRLGLEYFTHHTRGVEMTWGDGSPTVGRIFSSRLEEELGPAPLPRRGARDAPHRRCRRAPGAARGARARAGGVARRDDRLAEPLPRGRGRAERRGERANPARDAVRGALRPAGGRRLRNGGRGGAGRLVLDARPAARPRDAARLLRAVVRRRRSRVCAGRGRSRRRAARRRLALPARRRAARGGRRRRLVPGPHGARAARAREPLDPRRPAQRAR